MSHASGEYRFIIYLLFLGPTFFYQGFQNLKLKRRAEGLAHSKARSMAMGAVELCGTAGPIVALNDPVYQRSCAYYNIKIEIYRSTGRSGHWETLCTETSDGAGFICKDETGQVLVIPSHPRFYLSTIITKEKSLLGNDPSDPAYVYLSQRGASGNTLRLIANIIREGDPLYILGCAVPASSSELTARILPSKTVVSDAEAAALLKKDPVRFKQLDRNGDGNIDSLEWERGLQEFKNFLNAQKNQTGPAAAAPSESSKFSALVTCTPDVPLILANSEKYFLNKVGSHALLFVIGGGCATVIGLAMLISKYRAWG